MNYQNLETSLADGILTVKMNRPKKKNAMSPQMLMEIVQVLHHATENDSVDYVILTGNGDYYSSGIDLSASISSFEDTNSENPSKFAQNLVTSFIDFPKLLIAVVNGPAVGLAFTTLGLADLVYCSNTATFLAPFTVHGLSAEGCSSFIFPRIMGNAKATEILQLGKKLTAAEAKDCGLVTEIYDVEELNTVLLPKIRAMKNRLSKESIMANKKLIRQWQIEKLHEVNAAEFEEIENRMRSPEFTNTLIKFMESRKKRNNKL